MEDYVSFEQSKKLKELGFDWNVSHFYSQGELRPNNDIFCSDEDIVVYIDDLLHDMNNFLTYVYSAPTLAQAAKWLRKVKGIAVCVQSFDSKQDPRYGKFWWKEYFLPNCEERGPQWVEWWIAGQHPIFPNYEEALSDGISKMLELLK